MFDSDTKLFKFEAHFKKFGEGEFSPPTSTKHWKTAFIPVIFWGLPDCPAYVLSTFSGQIRVSSSSQLGRVYHRYCAVSSLQSTADDLADRLFPGADAIS